MSLFNRLLKLHNGSTPLEDFFTELVAHLFSTNKEILYDWLKYLDLIDTDADLDAYISTQQTFERLSHHFSDSRPDIIIELVDGNNRDIIFIESKIGSSEGCNQLQRYAEILNKLPGFRHKFLIYITREFEPKERITIFKEIPESKVHFKQARWHQFYQFLKTQTGTMLVEEIIKFMQEHQMAHNNQFSSIDVIALANFTNSLKLMDETMWGDVSQKFNTILGSISQRSTAFTELRYHGRYIMRSNMPNKLWCGLGFMLNKSNPSDYPTVILMLEVDPNSQKQTEIIQVMKDILQEYDWQGYNLGDSRAWAGIYLEKSLQNFLYKEDHIVVIQEFFRESLDKLNEIKTRYPQLPWVGINAGEAITTVPLSSTSIDVDVMLDSIHQPICANNTSLITV